jgi:ubiquitin carboxyl-terminal hydrolase 4/11/15
MLHRIGVEDNISFYSGQKGKRDLILNIQWQRDFEDAFIKQLSGMCTPQQVGKSSTDEHESSGDISLKDCFEEFRRPEMLDDDNKWYCNKCKDHVRATK